MSAYFFLPISKLINNKSNFDGTILLTIRNLSDLYDANLASCIRCTNVQRCI